MSVHVTSWVWKYSRASGNQRLVLLAIADHSHDNGQGAYPSVKALAYKCRMSPRAVQENIYRLQELGELEVEIKGSQYGTNLYTVVMGGDAESALGVTHDLRGGDADSRTGVTQRAALSLEEPLLEPLEKERANGAAAKKKRALPEGWKPTDDLLKWAADRLDGSVDVALETEKFTNYARSNNWRKVDWKATWRIWLLNAKQYAGERKRPEPAVNYEEL